MKVENLKKFIFENYYEQIGFTENDSYYSLWTVKKIYYYLLPSYQKKPNQNKTKQKELDPSKSITHREHYILFLENKDKKMPKTWKMKNCKESEKW